MAWSQGKLLKFDAIMDAHKDYVYRYRRTADKKYIMPIGYSPLAIQGDRVAAWRLWQDHGLRLPPGEIIR